MTDASWERVWTTPNKFLYNGANELNSTTGHYETHFRPYDPAIGRFTAVDPLASSFTPLTPYNYAFNDPVGLNDVTGAAPNLDNMQRLAAEADRIGDGVSSRGDFIGWGRGFNHGRIGASTGNHWSNQFGARLNAVLMQGSTFRNMYGIGQMNNRQKTNFAIGMSTSPSNSDYQALANAIGGSYENGSLTWYAIEGTAYASRSSNKFAGSLTVTPMTINLDGLSDPMHVDVTASRIYNNTMTPFDVGVEWLTGTGPRHRDFTNGDTFTEMLRQHDHVAETKAIIADRIANGGKLSDANPYNLGGIQGVGKYLKDYSTLATGGATGNLAVTYLGSYGLNWEVLNINGKMATVSFTVKNSSTIQSATRPPVIGYTEAWQSTIGSWLNQQLSSGPMSPKTQTFRWTETIRWRN